MRTKLTTEGLLSRMAKVGTRAMKSAPALSNPRSFGLSALRMRKRTGTGGIRATNTPTTASGNPTDTMRRSDASRSLSAASPAVKTVNLSPSPRGGLSSWPGWPYSAFGSSFRELSRLFEADRYLCRG